MDLSTFTNDLPGYVNLGIQVLLPIVVGLVTTRVTNARTQALLLLVLTAVNQFAMEYVRAVTGDDGGGVFDWKAAIWGSVIGFVISVATHFGLLKPMSVTGTNSWAEQNGRQADHDLAA